MKKCLCFIIILAEPCFHALGIHTGLEALAPLAMNYIASVDE